MKNLSKTISIIIFLSVISACTDNFEELNISPTQPVIVPAEYVLSQVELNGLMFDANNWWSVGSWVQHWASGTIVVSSQYVEDRPSWANLYSTLNNLTQIRNKILKGEENTPVGRTKLAIAKIIEVFLWQRMTDYWGDIPYSEACMPEDQIILQPQYDTQEDIYESLISDLNNAMNKLNATDISYGKADFVYNGSTEAWKKFANVLKLRMGMRLRYVNPTLAQSIVEEALQNPLFASNADNALMPTVPLNGNNIGFHPTIAGYNSSKEYNQLAEALVSTLVAKADPRLPLIAAPTENSKKAGSPAYQGLGVALGSSAIINRDDYSYSSIAIYGSRTTTFPFLIMSYSDVCFYKAEIALLGWGGLSPDDAQGFYQEAITAAMSVEPYKIEAQLITEYIEREGNLTGTAEEKLEQIMTQKWLSLFMRHYEAYAEWRRTGYPRLTPGPNKGDTDGEIPRRALYPADERLLNAENHATASDRYTNGDSYMSKVWWDMK